VSPFHFPRLLSGLQTNYNKKSPFYTGAMTISREQMIVALLDFGTGISPFEYLSFPVFKGKPKRAYFLAITYRINVKLATWKGTMLSIMCKVKLVKSISHGMLVYSFHVYMWPSRLLKQLDTYLERGCSYSEAIHGLLEGYVSSWGGGLS